jgi:SAM-dependent methyltransferase
MTFKQLFAKSLNRILAAQGAGRRVVIDLPAGSGETSRYLKEQGFEVLPFDLFPEFFSVPGLECKFCDITQGIPVADETANLIICQEGIEHFSDQVAAMKELSRVLKTGGTLVLTTPNYSSLKAKVSYLLNESEKYNRMMSLNEYDSIWYNRDNNENQYFGHMFLIGITKLRLLGKIAGFEIQKIHFSEFKSSNFLLFVIFYPFILVSSLLSYSKNVRKKPYAKASYKEILKLNINPKILVDGSLIVEFKKTSSVQEAKKALYQIGNYETKT